MTIDIQPTLGIVKHIPPLAAKVVAARQANDRLPLFRRFPPEILLRIASAVAQDEITLGRDVVVSASVALLSICSRWREIAFACHETWATIPLRNTEIAQTFLDRSYPAPIKFEFKGYSLDPSVERFRPYQDAAVLALGHLSRVRILNLRNVYEIHVNKIFPLLSSSPAPELEECRFSFHGKQLDGMPVQLPTSIFSCCVPPKLRILELSHCSMHASSPLLQGGSLTEIHLTCCRVWETVDEMVATLSRFPLLETFFAKEIDFLLRPAPSTLHSPRCVQLPNMQSFALAADFQQSMTMFHYLQLPPTAVVKINADRHALSDAVAMDAAFQSIVVFSLRDHYDAFISAGNVCSHATLSASEQDAFLAARWDSPRSFNPKGPELEVSFVPPLEVDASVAILSAILDALPIITSTKALTITGSHHSIPQLDEWRMFGSCRDVQDLTLEYTAVLSLVVSLRRTPSFHSLFPNLRVLRMLGVEFSRWKCADGVTTLFGAMLEALEGWFTSGRAEALYINCCEVTEGMIASLRAKLGQKAVIWDEWV